MLDMHGRRHIGLHDVHGLLSALGLMNLESMRAGFHGKLRRYLDTTLVMSRGSSGANVSHDSACSSAT